jgi:hypothetical protein
MSPLDASIAVLDIGLPAALSHSPHLSYGIEKSDCTYAKFDCELFAIMFLVTVHCYWCRE